GPTAHRAQRRPRRIATGLRAAPAAQLPRSSAGQARRDLPEGDPGAHLPARQRRPATLTAHTMIEAHEVRKQFGPVKALGGVSFSARDGAITALLGPNGAGKTTLLRALVGMLKRDHGSILIDGIDPERDPMTVRANIGFLTDQFGLYERLSTREYLAYFGELNGMAGASLRTRIDEVSQLLAMDDILERRSKGFSQG